MNFKVEIEGSNVYFALRHNGNLNDIGFMYKNTDDHIMFCLKGPLSAWVPNELHIPVVSNNRVIARGPSYISEPSDLHPYDHKLVYAEQLDDEGDNWLIKHGETIIALFNREGFVPNEGLTYKGEAVGVQEW